MFLGPTVYQWVKYTNLSIPSYEAHLLWVILQATSTDPLTIPSASKWLFYTDKFVLVTSKNMEFVPTDMKF